MKAPTPVIAALTIVLTSFAVGSTVAAQRALPEPSLSSFPPEIRRQLEQERSRAEERLQASGDTTPAKGEAKPSEVWGRLAMHYHAFDLSAAAAVCYANAAALDPDEFRWPYYLGDTLRRAGEPARALESLERAVAVRSDYLPAWIQLGELERIAGRPAEAARHYEKARSLVPDSAAALVGLARIDIVQREYGRAVERLSAARDSEPTATEIEYLLAVAHRGLGDEDEVARLSQSGIVPAAAEDPLLVEVWGLTRGKRFYQELAAEHYRAGRFERALAELWREVAGAPDDPGARLDLGRTLQALGDFAGSRSELERSIELDPNRSQTYNVLATALAWLGDDARAAQHYEAALALDPQLGEARFQLANALRRSGRFEQSIEHYRRTAETNPTYAAARLGEALALIRLHRYQDARERLEAGLAALPDDRGLRRTLVRLLAAAPEDGVRDGARALELARPLVAAGNVQPDHVVVLAMAAAENGDFGSALRLQRQAIEWYDRYGRSDALTALRENLALYESGQPCRRPWTDDDPRLSPGPLTPPSGPTTMPRLLERLAVQIDPETNVFLNEERAEWLVGRIAQAELLVDQYIRKFERAQELLRSGDALQAVEQARELIQAYRMLGAEENSDDMRNLRTFLALAFLRLGEQENCINRHTAESCLMPIDGSGIHTDQRGSRAAIDAYTRLLEMNAGKLEYRWLLSLAYMTVGEYPDAVPEAWRIPPEVFTSDYDPGRFRDVAQALGVDVNEMAGGSIIEDFDGDGLLDLMASSWGLRDQLRFFHNNGDGSFSDWTERAGLVGQVGGLNMTHADYDNDGHPDVLVLRGGWWPWGSHPNSLLRNNGDGTFSDVTRRAELLSFHPTQTAAWADFDLDGWLDLFIGNESLPGNPHPCELYMNNGDGSFREIAAETGLALEVFAKGVAADDFDNDGLPDLYISRFAQPNLLLHNDGPREGGWRFTDVTDTAGVAGPLASFPVWFWDYDNDGWQDILVASFADYLGNSLEIVVADYLGMYDGEHSALYHNNRDGTFTDVSKEAGVDAALLAMGANYGDLDNDGFLDPYFGTGQPRMNTLVPNRMYRNAGGRTFQDVTTSGGFGHLQKGHGIAFGDLDNDGDQDIYAVMGGAFSGDTFQNALFLNPGNDNHWITLRLVGVNSNRSAIGARIKITLETEQGERIIYGTVTTGGSFGSSSLQHEIGLGSALRIKSIEISWPSSAGQSQVITEVTMDRVLEVHQGERPVEVELHRVNLEGRVGAMTDHHHH
jgi:tetratricopeptide (TPR) repeat protein